MFDKGRILWKEKVKAIRTTQKLNVKGGPCLSDVADSDRERSGNKDLVCMITG